MLDIKEVEKLYKEFCKQPMTDYCIINNGEKIYTNTGHALEGAKLFVEFIKKGGKGTS